MAELKNLLFAARQVRSVPEMPLRIEAASGDEQYLMINKKELRLKPGKVYIADSRGILLSIRYGPDSKTTIKPETYGVLSTTCGSSLLDTATVEPHLGDRQTYVRIVYAMARCEYSSMMATTPQSITQNQ